ncbi:MFS transporter [Brevundimonas subvibrioides]|uniref:Major facilitator superfamily MFS_1 n=1 Tax=Brevundimonas subvibrioides (strain ATCC 15264 / DSM 4735 / LMG 14903 / NBRC 16000 / CB 81) TaxID=633149 RepID=D9QJQ4_BRESC|nr:MFS transporter [Brevundimonas subvibrioides]ADK99655.1 major facilitator superfamily MFS_1 [Brevundimonas subvibrioides ATCC 15264]
MSQTPSSVSAETPNSDRRALAVLFAIVFINLVGFGLVVPLLPFFGSSLNAAPWQVALMFSAYSVGQFFAEPFWGRLSDRIGRKPVLLITVAANAVGYLMLAFAPNIWVAIGIRLFTGLGAGNVSTVQGYVADVTPPEKRAGRMGLIGAAFGAGFIAGPGLSGILVREDLGRLGYQLPIFAACGLATLAALGVLFLLKESLVRRDGPAPARTPFLGGVRDAAANPVVSRVILVTLIYMAGFSGMESTFGLFTGARFGWGAREVAFSFMAVGIVSVICQSLVTGRLSRRFGESRMLAVGCVLFGCGLVGQMLAPVAWAVPVAMGIGAFGMAMTMPNISAMISRATPPDRQGAMLGLNMAASSSGRIFGPVVAGFMFSSLGHDWPLAVGAVLMVPAALMALNAGRAVAREAAVPAAAE